MTRSRVLPLALLVLLPALLVFALPALVVAAPGPPPDAVPAALVHVIDGDSIHVLIGTRVERIRYIGIDAPERSQPGYIAATEANRSLLQSGADSPRLLYLLPNPDKRTELFNTFLLRYVYLADGRLVQAELLAGGWAAPVEYPPDVRFAKLFRQLAVQAAQKRLGFWSRTPPRPDGAMSYALTATPARIRKGPGTTFAINTTVAKDTPLIVLGRTAAGDWLQVRTPTRARGWISTSLVQQNVPVTQAPVPSHIPQAAPPAKQRAPAPVEP